MADQRPVFRFRLPWLPAGQPPRPSFAPRPPTQPTTTPRTPQTAATQLPPTQPTITPTPTPSSSTTTQTAETQVPPMQPTTTAATSAPTAQTAETEAPPQSTTTTTPSPATMSQAAETQNATQQPTSTITPVPTAERPPFRPPGLAPSPQSQTSRTQTQPPSPSRSTTQPRIPSQPASPARAATQSQAPSQPSTPPHATPQPRAVSLPSSPSRRSPQLPSAPQTATQPRSPSLPAIRPSEQTSSPPSPSKSVSQVLTTTEAGNQPTSPLKREESLTKESSESSEISTEVVSSISGIQETKSAISESPSLDLHPKAEAVSEVVNDPRDQAPLETGSQLNEIKQQPSEELGIGAAKTSSPTEGPETPAPTQVSNNSTVNPEPESFPKELKPNDTKEVKEVTQSTKDRAQEEARSKESNIPGELGNTLHTRGTSAAFQSEQTLKTVSRKDVTATSASNGRQTKITTAQPKNIKSMPVDNRHKLPMSSGEHIPLHKEIREDISQLVHKMAAGRSKQSIDDRPVSVVTLAGENRGATTYLGSDSSRKEGAVHIHRGYKIKPDDSAEATTDGEESFKTKSNHPKTKEDQAPEAYVNSNVQGINNSLMFNSSITERNPGVHLILSKSPTELKTPSGKPELLETRKAEFNVTPSRMLTHEPIVRRRCLRGLFLESSDSDLDSTKPRSHGCRVGCNEKRKDNNIDVL